MMRRTRRAGRTRGHWGHGRSGSFARTFLDDLFNRTAALVILILLAPVIAIVALAICADSPGAPFFRCARVGQHGRPFRMFKFRKMRDGASGPPLTAPQDQRLTRIGAFLARSKLDELPQLVNVVAGQMNLVGPRPEDPRLVAECPDAFRAVARLRPGITGLSQLAFRREAEMLDPGDPVSDYLERVLPRRRSCSSTSSTAGCGPSASIWPSSPGRRPQSPVGARWQSTVRPDASQPGGRDER
jgi:lipopolysaccharide/colanic/teichoic acid biosynthesis glycosyltransferase